MDEKPFRPSSKKLSVSEMHLQFNLHPTSILKSQFRNPIQLLLMFCEYTFLKNKNYARFKGLLETFIQPG